MKTFKNRYIELKDEKKKPLNEEKVEADLLKTANSFFQTLSENDTGINNLIKALEENIFSGSTITLKSKDLSKSLTVESDYKIAEDSGGYNFFINLKFDYPKENLLSKFFDGIMIELTNAAILQEGKTSLSIYFDTNKILLLQKNGETVELPIVFIVYYSLNLKSFRVILN